MAQRWMRAQDTFVAQLKDGTQRMVTKGETLPDSHELVKRDLAGSGTLFKALDQDEEAAPKSPAKAAAPKVTRAAGKAS